MRDFTHDNWQATLTLVYERAAFDPVYRELCLTDPYAAVREVSDIDLPPHFEFEFVGRRKDIFYSLLLPPFVGEKDALTTEKEIVAWALSTHPTMGLNAPPPPPQPPPTSSTGNR